MNPYTKAGSFPSVDALRDYLAEHSIDLPLAGSGKVDALARPATVHGHPVGNRWALLPMEGWDCMPDGAPSAFTRRRWLNFARSGAKLLFGTEAGAISHEARSNPYQLLVARHNLPALRRIVAEMRALHRELHGTDDDLVIGLQLTHSGRFAHPNRSDRLEPVVAYRHPVLDRKFKVEPHVVTDAEIGAITTAYATAATVAREAGFDFVDLKCAHGYLGHEFLSAVDRPGPYGGSLENRTRFLREAAEKIREACPDLPVAMRLSIFDIAPFEKGSDGVGVPMARDPGPYRHAFGGSGDGLTMDPDLAEPAAFVRMMQSLGVELVCGTVGSPYYNVHLQRPAYYPVSDGYLPPEDPLYNVSRHIAAARRLKQLCPGIQLVLSGITCLQEYAVNAAEAAIESGAADFAGLGRMALSYPEYCADTLAGKRLDRCRICRTFGDCTNAPRRGEISGCYKLDPAYRSLPKGQTPVAIAPQ